MKLKKFIGSKLFTVLNCLALITVVQTANVACVWAFHQPEFPREADKYRKLK